jgi:KDO2-lipid IV(A) lauroyltransferase
MQIIDKNGASLEASKVLARGGKLGLVGDQDAGPKGIFVDFLGRPASTFKSIALLALEFQAPILVIGCLRTSEPLHYMLVLEDAIMPEEYLNDPGAVRAVTQRYTSALERIVRRYPEQYFWFHRRWKNQPSVKRAKKAA